MRASIGKKCQTYSNGIDERVCHGEVLWSWDRGEDQSIEKSAVSVKTCSFFSLSDVFIETRALEDHNHSRS